MEKNRSLTFTDQSIIDTELTSIKSKEIETSPFDFALESSIKDWTSEHLEKDEVSYPSLKDINENLLSIKEYQNNAINHDVQYLRNYSKTLQSWKGVIVEIKDGFFTAELSDLTNGGTKEIAEIELLSVSPDDRELVSLGASFYWSIGYKMSNGQITKESLIRFQRVIDWDSDDVDQWVDRASDLFESIKFDE